VTSSARVALATALVGLLTAAWGRAALAWEYYETKGGVPVHWCADTLTYHVDGSGIDGIEGDGEYEVIHWAFDTWSELETPFQFVFGTYKSQPEAMFYEEGDNENQVVFIRENWISEVGADSDDYVALTTLSYLKTTGEIVDADIRLNLDQYAFSLCLEPEDLGGELRDLWFVMLHEVGHITGLDHSPDSLAVLFVHDSRCSDEPPHALTPDDVQGHLAVYESPPCPVEYIEPDPFDGGTLDQGNAAEGCVDCALSPSCCGCRSGGGTPLGPLLPALLCVLGLWLLRARRILPPAPPRKRN